MPANRPAQVTPNLTARTLDIQWQDGSLCRLPMDFLRGACPCATCKGGHREVDLGQVTPVLGVYIVDLMPLGDYALRFLWSDSHHTGIYSFDYLRSLCQYQARKSPRE